MKTGSSHTESSDIRRVGGFSYVVKYLVKVGKHSLMSKIYIVEVNKETWLGQDSKIPEVHRS